MDIFAYFAVKILICILNQIYVVCF